MVGPILAEPAKPLPHELSSFLERGKGEGLGAVYVSMGSAARLPETALHSMALSLSAMLNPVLWKLSPKDLPGVPHDAQLSVFFASAARWMAWHLSSCVASCAHAVATVCSRP